MLRHSVVMLDNATAVQLDASFFGANLRAAMSDYPLDEKGPEVRVAMTVRLPASVAEDVELLCSLWTSMDRARGLRRHKWLPSRVLARLVENGVSRFWEQVGGRPASKADREEWARRAVASLEAELTKAKAKK